MTEEQHPAESNGSTPDDTTTSNDTEATSVLPTAGQQLPASEHRAPIEQAASVGPQAAEQPASTFQQPAQEPAQEPFAQAPSATASYSYYEASVPPETSAGQPPAFPFGTQASSPQPRHHNNKLVAGLVAAALVVGVGAGAGTVALVKSSDNNSSGNPSASSSTDNGSGDDSKGGSKAEKSPIVTDDSSDSAPEGSAEAVAAKVLPSVVKISVSGQQGSGSGSGIIISSDGEILTNNHVVDLAGNGGSITVNFNDGTGTTATVVGTDPVTDLAVIKAANISGLTPATLNSSDSVSVGETVLAIGSPFGLDATVTSGIVSALNRPVTVSSDESQSPFGGSTGQDTTYPAIQTDAAINPGNSGGPLVNMKGEVIGINSSIRSASSGYGSEAGSIGLGFAIPISKVLPVVQQLEQGQTATHARLGVTVGDVNSNDPLVTGAQIAEITSGGAADKAGIKSGDIVTKVDGELITGTESLIATIRGYRPGDTVTVTIKRGNDTQDVKATLDSDGGQVTS